MKRFIVISAGVIAAFCALVFGLFWLHNRSCYQNTVYSERFTEAAFARISIGMPRASVVESLGAPLESDIREKHPVWAIADEATRNRYGRDNEIALESLMFSKPKDQYRDFNWVSVIIGPDGRVVGSSSYITD